VPHGEVLNGRIDAGETRLGDSAPGKEGEGRQQDEGGGQRLPGPGVSGCHALFVGGPMLIHGRGANYPVRTWDLGPGTPEGGFEETRA
jgi:hypothetical protein